MLSACVTGEPTRNELVSDQVIEPPAHIRLVKGGGAFSSCADMMRVSEESYGIIRQIRQKICPNQSQRSVLFSHPAAPACSIIRMSYLSPSYEDGGILDRQVPNQVTA